MIYRETSRAAWDSFAEVSGLLDRDILIALYDVYPDGLTDEKVEKRLGREHQSVSGNRRHLVERGYVEDSKRKERNTSGRLAIIWVAVIPPQPPPVEPPKPRARRGHNKPPLVHGKNNVVGQLVLACISNPAGALCSEIVTKHKIRHQSVSARINDHFNDGLIKDSGLRRLTKSKRQAIVWVRNMRLKSELRSYQRRVVDHLYECQEAFAVLKMGAGKTIATLTAIDDLLTDKVIRHALIIAPKRVATITWPAEIAAWAHTKDLRYNVLDGNPTQRWAKLTNARERDLTIVGIDNVQWLVEILKDVEAENPIWDCLVIDETSKLKDPKSLRAKALATISSRFKNRWGLTGTPTPNSLLDLFTPTRIITNGRLWGNSFYKWQKQNFYPTDFNQYNWAVLPGHDKQILADAASISIALGEGDMPDLPELSILVDEVDLPPEARRDYRDMERKLFANVADQSIVAVSAAVATGKLAQMANGFVYDAAGADGAHTIHDAKAVWLKELIDGLDGEPTIIVYEYQEDLAMIRRLLGDLPYLGAGVGDKAAQEAVDGWNRGALPLLALHPASGGHGLNLQHGGSRMVWLAPCWSAEYWDQTIARIHRPGQGRHVMVHVCVATNTVDELKRMRVISKLSAQAAFERYLASTSAAGGYLAGRPEA